MADIVETLFGVTTPSKDLINNYRNKQASDIGTLWGQATLNPYDKNVNAEAYINSHAAQAQLASQAVRTIGGMFGIKDPMLEKASAIEGILQQTQQELGADASNPAVLYPALTKRLQEAGHTREAMQVGQIGATATREAAKEQADISYKQGLTKYYDVLGKTQEMTAESKAMEIQGQVAYGGLKAYTSAKDPAVKTKVWENTLDALAKKGVDIAPLKEIPWEERENALNSIVDSADTSATRMKEEVAGMQNQFKQQKLQQDWELQQQRLSLQAAIANMKEAIANDKLNSAERIAANRKMSSFEDQLKLLVIREKNDTQAGYASSVGTKEANKEVASYLKEDVGLTDANQIKTATNEYNTLYKNYLGQKDSSGLPLYDNVTASNMAKKAIEANIETEPTFFGFGKGKPKYSGKAKTVIKLD